MEEERRAKRSRFDDGPTQEKRRSASPERKVATPPISDEAAAKRKKAAEAAARLSAMLKTKKASSPAVTPKPPSASPAPRPPADDMNEHGLYVRDIEVNDLRNRYLVVKESTLEEIKTKTGVDIEVRGKYYPDKSMATERDPPMFLHISSPVKTKTEAAVGMANKLINSELGPLVDERRFRKKEDFERDEFGRRKWPEEKVMIDMAPVRGFHLRASVVGTGGANVKFVQQETRTRIQIKGQGSGFQEGSADTESDEPMHLHITGPDAAEVHRAKGMLEDLIASIKVKYEDFKLNGPRDENQDRGDRHDSPAQGAYGSPAPNGYPGYDHTSSSSYLPPPPGVNSAAIAPPFGFSSAPPPPPGSLNFAPPPPGAGQNSAPYSSSLYANPGPPPPSAAAPPPPPPGAPAPPGPSRAPYGSYPPAPPGEEYDPYAPSTGGYARPPGT